MLEVQSVDGPVCGEEIQHELPLFNLCDLGPDRHMRNNSAPVFGIDGTGRDPLMTTIAVGHVGSMPSDQFLVVHSQGEGHLRRWIGNPREGPRTAAKHQQKGRAPQNSSFHPSIMARALLHCLSFFDFLSALSTLFPPSLWPWRADAPSVRIAPQNLNTLP